jgi:S-methylmethionine-dependent homocysteine/selenocysteine methylase
MAGPLAALLEHSPMLILDGAMGTELQGRGIDVSLPLWSARALIAHPDSVLQIHKEYIAAGADIITANTFRTTRRVFTRAGLADLSASLTRLAVELAHQARTESSAYDTLIAGSMAPLEDCYRPDLVPEEHALHSEHADHARRLADAGADFLLLETMGTVREARAACRAAAGTGKEVVVSFLCASNGCLYNGEPIDKAVNAIAPCNPTAFSLNCLSPRHIAPALRALQAATSLPVAVYANVGRAGEERKETFIRDVTPEEYLNFAEGWRQLGVRIVGGCCGTTPAYIEKLRKSFAPKERQES